jgi:S-adenosylmethionine hydrolase
LLNSDRLLELAVYQSSAQQQLQLEVGDTVTIDLPLE